MQGARGRDPHTLSQASTDSLQGEESGTSGHT